MFGHPDSSEAGRTAAIWRDFTDSPEAPLKAFAGDPRVLTLRPNTWLDHAIPARSLAAPAL